jgi:hypothetical protein
MSVDVATAQLTPLLRPVYVVVKTSDECAGDPLLASLSCHDGPVAEAIQEKFTNLLSGNAWEQTVAFVVEEETDTPLAVASVCLSGHPGGRAFPLAYTRRISVNPYINLLARDDHHRNCALLDGTTRLGTAALRAVLEVVARENSGQLPLVWAFVDPQNAPSLKSFGRFAFHPREQRPLPGLHKPDLVLVRPSGKPLPTPPNPVAYRPVLKACVSPKEYPLA